MDFTPSYLSPYKAELKPDYYSPPSFQFSQPDFVPSFRPNTYGDDYIPAQDDFPALPSAYLGTRSAEPQLFNPSSSEFVPGSFAKDFDFLSDVTPPRGFAARTASEEEEKDRKKQGLQSLFALKKATDPDMSVLAVGKDLFSLRNRDTSAANLLSPFSDKPRSPSERPEFSLPRSYFVGKPILKASHLQKFSLGTLFYIFYNVVGERLQALAAEELYRREWLYESKSSLWYVLQGGEWKVFDLSRWETVACSPPQNPAFLPKEEVKASKPSAPA